MRGSSPLTRGKPGRKAQRRRRPGLIPTHAGKTATRPPPRSSPTAHPHSRGENPMGLKDGLEVDGSSPLTRGKRSLSVCWLNVKGLIPTHAGKTCRPWSPTKPKRAHPHSRGENHARKVAKPGDKGSSPLTRGKPSHSMDTLCVGGLIPTHAGKTHILATRYPPKRGSSPLTRGKLCWLSIVLVCVGLIPTHAGKTLSPGSASVRTPAHPHSRGENRVRASRLSRSRGSSPLTRGKHSISLRTCR